MRNSLALYGENIVTAADKVRLEKKVDTILSEANRATTISSAKMTNSFTITQNVKLAPLYNLLLDLWSTCGGRRFRTREIIVLIRHIGRKRNRPIYYSFPLS